MWPCITEAANCGGRGDGVNCSQVAAPDSRAPSEVSSLVQPVSKRKSNLAAHRAAARTVELRTRASSLSGDL